MSAAADWLFDGSSAEAPLDWIACSDKQAREYFRLGFIVRRDRHGQWYVESTQHAESRQPVLAHPARLPT